MNMIDHKLPENLPCPFCKKEKCIEQFLSSPSALGDPIRLGITKPPSEFLHGVLGRMEKSVPDRSIVGKDGKLQRKNVSFSKANFQPGRTI
jgi:hypothetical protein